MVVTASSHPTLFTMFAAVANDAGVSIADSWDVTAYIDDGDLDRAEAAAAALTSEQRDSITIGEQEVLDNATAHLPGGELINSVLGSFLESIEDEAEADIEEEGSDV